MTDDLISRQAAIEAIEKTGLPEDEADTAIRVIEMLPSAQKHGKWIPRIGKGKIPLLVCSVCGDFWDDGGYFYCPTCGADMRGEQQDHEKQQKEQEKNEWEEFWAKDPKAGEWWPTPSNETNC